MKGEENTYFLAWTTTPWTLPSNVALCMNAKIDYVKIKANGEYYILAKPLVNSLFEDYEIVDTRKGKDYEYVEYEPLFDFYKEGKKAFFVTNAEYVTTTDGTGVVHIAPAFGEDDTQVGRAYNLPLVQFVDARGRLTADCGSDLEGLFVKDADKVVLRKLKENGLLFKKAEFTHNYPFCWRCDTPLIYFARSSWFIKMTAVRDKLLKNNDTVNWMPPSIKNGRFGNFLENVIDWGFSRERYWGTPLPIWICDKCGKRHVVGSRKELCELAGLEKRPNFINRISTLSPGVASAAALLRERRKLWTAGTTAAVCRLRNGTIRLKIRTYLKRFSLQTSFGGSRSDERLVLHSYGNFHVAVRQEPV